MRNAPSNSDDVIDSRDILERRFYGGRRLAARHQPVAVGAALDQHRLGGGGATIGGEDGADGTGRGDHDGFPAREARVRASAPDSIRRVSASSASRRAISAAHRW